MTQYRDDAAAARLRIETLEAQLDERDASLRAREAELREAEARAAASVESQDEAERNEARRALAAGQAAFLGVMVCLVVCASIFPLLWGASTRADAARACVRLGLGDLRRHLVETPKGLRGRVRVLLAPASLAHAAADALARRGVRARVERPARGSARAFAARLVRLARELSPGEAAVVVGEPTLALPSRPGRGGRAGFTALAAWPALPEGAWLLAAASDGRDGSSGAAGALVRGGGAPIDVERALARFDDASAHERAGSRLDLAPTGTNLTDLYVLLR